MILLDHFGGLLPVTSLLRLFLYYQQFTHDILESIVLKIGSSQSVRLVSGRSLGPISIKDSVTHSKISISIEPAGSQSDQ